MKMLFESDFFRVCLQLFAYISKMTNYLRGRRRDETSIISVKLVNVEYVIR